MTGADVLAYGSMLWGIAQVPYHRLFKGQADASVLQAHVPSRASQRLSVL